MKITSTLKKSITLLDRSERDETELFKNGHWIFNDLMVKSILLPPKILTTRHLATLENKQGCMHVHVYRGRAAARHHASGTEGSVI